MEHNLQEFLDWQETSEKLKKLKEEEAKLRTELSESVLKGSQKAVKFELDGFVIKATPKLNTNVDEAVFDSIFDELSLEEKAAVAMKPKLVKKLYNKLEKGCLLEDAITVTPGRPTLDVDQIDRLPL